MGSTSCILFWNCLILNAVKYLVCLAVTFSNLNDLFNLMATLQTQISRTDDEIDDLGTNTLEAEEMAVCFHLVLQALQVLFAWYVQQTFLRWWNHFFTMIIIIYIIKNMIQHYQNILFATFLMRSWSYELDASVSDKRMRKFMVNRIINTEEIVNLLYSYVVYHGFCNWFEFCILSFHFQKSFFL